MGDGEIRYSMGKRKKKKKYTAKQKRYLYGRGICK
jgi:hypothetical protein